MPTLEDNLRQWNETYNWPQGGDEWSSFWGGADAQWYNTIVPRIHAFLPATAILEIAPGFGRWSHFLKDYCERLVLVDISEKCIQACRERFNDFAHLEYHVNDGRSLSFIDDGCIDFAFSFDSLVHVEDHVIKAYLAELARVLTSDGIGVIHHSNLHQYQHYLSLINKMPYRVRRRLDRLHLIETLDAHWRAPSMSASRFHEYARAVGLQCISQEKVNWGSKRLTDCISVCTPRTSRWARPNKTLNNFHFMLEAQRSSLLSKLYGADSFGVDPTR
ncbi:MAG TPA: class I SAM-dependent methyltransferase [Chloroflexota bacterium]|nr:class I SAM-dependent methyltransferase [Chloroflexota bacterium]